MPVRLRNHPPRATTALAAATALAMGAALLTGCTTGEAGEAAAPPSARPTTPAAAASAAAENPAASDHSISFVVDGTTTYGTLHIPAHTAGTRLPAALLLPGSGPTDRDGNQPRLTPYTLTEIARLMGDDGIATLRYDKYGTGRTGLGAYEGKAATLDLAAYVRQADAAYRFLAAQATTDPHRLSIAGHSEGGMIALELAQFARPAPAGLVLLEPQDERLLDLATLQLDSSLDAAVTADRLDAAEAGDIKADIAQAVTDLRDGRPADTTGMPASVAAVFEDFNANATFVRTDDAVYPPSLARQVAEGTEVMVTCGTADTNVPCSTTGPLLAALTAAGTTGPGLVTLPGVNHLLQPAGPSAAASADASPSASATSTSAPSGAASDSLAPAAQQAIHTFDTLWR
ncbi:alpha/beta hydrolase [Kitasatospora sp. GP82]|uniref:alpha/beta hydrolase n=1 Tax=Kitasatospora sp. GP82 TaxID=3035089 RepID=UPI002477185D|nr:alpha/beta hydrolase [Kitasatospora sp. GP82]MDH6123620.1 alpha-beta hydrolase superfamily lysophospholipase [Kitasatospora sp. GP82]